MFGNSIFSITVKMPLCHSGRDCGNQFSLTDAEIRKTGLSHIISCRIDEIFEKIKNEIENSGHSNQIRAGIVFTGGGARISGLDEYAEAKFSCPARIGAPAAIKGIGNVSGKTRYSTAVGLLLYRASKLKGMADGTKSHSPFFLSLQT